LGGLSAIQWPYAGDDEWVSLSVLLGAPALAVPAAALAFWPAGRASAPLRAIALVLLLVLYGLPATERDFGAELLRGAVLLVLVTAWLWPPRLGRREVALAAGVVLSAAGLAVPVAAALDTGRPWLEYRTWGIFATTGGVAFDFNHDYGPIDWPRRGTTLLSVRSDRPLYWRVLTLDRFDGLQWVHTRQNERTSQLAELPPSLDSRWEREVRVRVRNLNSDLVVVTGMPFSVSGLGRTFIAGDGTTFSAEGSIKEGDEYTVRAYVPDPSARRLRRAPESWQPLFAQYTRVELPQEGVTAIDGTGRAGDAARSAAAPPLAVEIPFRGSAERAVAGGLRIEARQAEEAARLLRASPYAATYALARRLADGAPTSYDVVRRIERHLLEGYEYDENPPERDHPIDDFLHRDRLGYCQQFSGAMALMLRMNGIPARVVGGFAPGSFNKDRGEFRVRDLDAHSWVEVYFTGIGWVQFDPTPPAAPAESRALSERAGAASAATGSTGPSGAERGAQPGGGGGSSLPSSGGEESRLPLWALALVLAAAALAAALVRGRRRLGRSVAESETPIAELARAVRRLGLAIPPRTTLLELEQRLGRLAGPAGTAYARALREWRYGPAGTPAPGRAERAALRKGLAERGGIGARARAWIALPPFTRL
ncbi:MAG TPA: transglutaminaseTgpA domain-containing protein, partial [Thermoleophilaceae bacterium]|nr:transglutaminaseTgpA domain-containing protein [Thermoleophilaceae bacterium]